MGCKPHPDLGDFEHFDHDPGYVGIVRGHCVYRAPKSEEAPRKPVILLHELFGLSPDCAELARRLVDDGFSVFMPVLFGEPLGNGPLNAAKMCISREFTLLKTNKTSKMTNWVRSLANRIATDRPGSTVGVIGMCLTAHVVFPLTYEASVGAVVASQSAIPWIRPGNTDARRRSLGMSREDAEKIEGAGKLAAVCALRFECDPISPPERMETVATTFPDGLIRQVVDPVADREPSMMKPHSVLTGEYDPNPGTDTHAAYREVVAFLHDNLSGA